MKEALRRILPNKAFMMLKSIKSLKKVPKLISNYNYDLIRLLKYSSLLNDDSQLKLEAQISKNYHVLEKGLSMPQPRKGFGQDKVKNLLELLYRYNNSGYSMDRSQIKSSIIVLEEYFSFHKDYLDENIDKMRLKASDIFNYKSKDIHVSGGKFIKFKRDLLSDSKGDFKALANSRYSIRNFTNEPVKIEKVLEAINIAQKTPSVCNRQSARIYIVKDKESVNKVLALQNGNRGFGHLIDSLLIVTSDLSAFIGTDERNQAYIDGGMYAMSLLYALHYEGLGACPLNWSVLKDKDKKLRNTIEIGESENIIMIIGMGNLPEEIDVAISCRKSVEEVTKII